MTAQYLPEAVNVGPWATAYTLNSLREYSGRFALPICSLATPDAALYAAAGERLLLPPLFVEAMDGLLRERIVQRIMVCFPVFGDESANRARVDVVEIDTPSLPDCETDQLIAFSVDTAVEEHGPHLPLATDTIQSYGVLQRVAALVPEVEVFRPLDYGQLTWGLPFGHSVDLTVELLSEYVRGFAQAVCDWRRPQAIYVVDVHGSITHRQAIVAGLRQAELGRWGFRWLHEPLAEFASARGDQHAGGVETACVEFVSPRLLDPRWWPARMNDIAAQQMSFQEAVDLTPDLAGFCREVQLRHYNGVIGDIRNYKTLDPSEMFSRMVRLAADDVKRLLDGNFDDEQDAGLSLW